MLNLIAVGLGKQMTKDHIPSVLRRNDVEIVAVVDKDARLAKEVGERLKVSHFTEVNKAVMAVEPDLAIVCVPHNAYIGILEVLAKHRIATLKEKPLAVNVNEARQIVNLYDKNDAYLQICVQRRFSKLYDTAKRLINEIGAVKR